MVELGSSIAPAAFRHCFGGIFGPDLSLAADGPHEAMPKNLLPNDTPIAYAAAIFPVVEKVERAHERLERVQ